MSDINYTDFHRLIEIAVKLNKAFEDEKRLSTIKTRGNVTMWQKRLKEWIEVNYNDNGKKK